MLGVSEKTQINYFMHFYSAFLSFPIHIPCSVKNDSFKVTV